MKYIEDFVSGSYRNNGDYRSFIPSSIDDIWTWSSPEINSLLSEADQEIGALSSFSELVPDIELYIRMHLRVEANRSSRIEGTMTSVEEDMLPREILNAEQRCDVLEIDNYVKALDYGVSRILADDFPFTSRLLRELHQILMQGVRGEHKTPGEFRRSQNFIGGSKPSDALYVPPALIDMDEAISDFDKFAHRNGIPILIKLALMHYQFETIHPFLDGNGRIGRLMIPLFLLSEKKLIKPCFYISSYFEKHRSEYYDALQKARTENDMKRWVCFFLNASLNTAREAKSIFSRAIRQVEEYNSYIINKGSQHKAIGITIKAMYSKPVTTAMELAEDTGLSIQSVNQALKILLEDSIVAELSGKKRNRIFKLTEYMDIFSRD